MAVTSAVLIAAKTAENAQTTQYTSTGVTTIIDKFTATNYSSLPASLSVNLVTNADVAGSSNLIVKTKTLQVGETYTFPEITNFILGSGDFISTLASAAASINIRSSGRIITA